jgi:hypothetical protein
MSTIVSATLGPVGGIHRDENIVISLVWLVADAVPPNQSPISLGIACAEKFPGISQFIRELAGFRAVGRTPTCHKPLTSRVNLNTAVKIP